MAVNKIPTQTQEDKADSNWNNDKLKPVLDSYADTLNGTILTITQGSGAQSLVRNKISKFGSIIVVEIAGTFTTGTGNKVIGSLPVEALPERTLRTIGVALVGLNIYGAQQFLINRDSKEITAENIPTTAPGGSFQFNIMYTV